MLREYSIEQLEEMLRVARAKRTRDASVRDLQRVAATESGARNAMALDFSGGSCIANSCNG
jgi:hypothetical protein